jgi:quercetin dioxygenase-like cupin family protein
MNGRDRGKEVIFRAPLRLVDRWLIWPARRKGIVMRSKWLRTALIALVVLVAVAGVVGRSRAAQQATPGPIAVTQLAPGVTAEVFAAAPSQRASGQTVYLARFTFQSGAAIFPHSHPGTTVLGVASGELGWTLVKGTAHVARGAAAGASGPTEDLTKPGDDVILKPGDAIYYEDDVVHTARGAGDQPAVVLGTLVLTTGQPLLMPTGMAMGATPTP